MLRMGRIYAAFLKASWMKAFEYRAQVFLWLLSGIFPLVMMAVWLTMAREAGSINGWQERDFASYYVAVVFINYLTGVWILWDWDENIRTGNLSVKLLKPLDPIHELFIMETLGWKMLMLSLITPLIMIVALVSDQVNYPMSLLQLSALLTTGVLAMMLNLFFASLFGVMSFWTTQTRNLYSLVFGIGQFLSGFIAPLPMFPENIQKIARLLPFRSYLGFPVEIMMGRLNSEEIAFGLAVTVFWTAIFFLAYRFLWHRGLKRYEAVGA